MSRYFPNSARGNQEGWKRLQRYSGDLTPFYVRHDSFIKVTSEEVDQTPKRNFTITKRSHSEEVSKEKDKVKEPESTDLRAKLRKVAVVEPSKIEGSSTEKKKKPAVKKKKSSKIDHDNDVVSQVSDSVKLREKCQNDEAEERAEETDRIARHAGDDSVKLTGDGGTPDILRSSRAGESEDKPEEISRKETGSQEEKYRQESQLISLIENFYDQVNEAKDKAILLATSANSAIENAAIIEDIVQSIDKETDGRHSHSIDKAVVDQAGVAANASEFHSEETRNIAEVILGAKEKALIYFSDISASNCKVETPDIIRSSRLAKNTKLASQTETGNDSAIVDFDYLQDCEHCIKELEIIESQILRLSDTALKSSEEARQQQERLNELATRSENDKFDHENKNAAEKTDERDAADKDLKQEESIITEIESSKEKVDAEDPNERSDQIQIAGELDLKQEKINIEEAGAVDPNSKDTSDVKDDLEEKLRIQAEIDSEEGRETSAQITSDNEDFDEKDSQERENEAKREKEEERLREEREAAATRAEEVTMFQRELDEIQVWISEKNEALDNDNVGHDLETVQALLSDQKALDEDLGVMGVKIKQLDEEASRMMESQQGSSEIIYKKQKDINDEWTQLLSKANQRKVALLDSSDLQRFLSDYRDLMSWVSSMMSLISTEELAMDVTGAEALLERHQEHRTEIDARSGTFQEFELFGQQLLQADHFAAGEVQEKLESMNITREDLEMAWIGRHRQLDQCLELQLFYRDCEQAENWMTSRESLLSTENAADSNEDDLEAMIKMYEDLEAAVRNQEEKIASLEIHADHLVQRDHFAAEEISQKKTEILAGWERLKEAKAGVEERLGEELLAEEARKAEGRRYEEEVRELSRWLGEVESLLNTEEVSQDLASSQFMMEKHHLVEADIVAHEDRIKDVTEQAERLVDCGKFDCDDISKRYKNIQDLADHRQAQLKEANTLHLLLRDIADEESWIREKKLLLSCDVGVEGTHLEDQEMLERELTSHEFVLQELRETGAVLGGAEMEEKVLQLTEEWQELKETAQQRRRKLEESIIYQQFLAKIEEEEAWMSEKQQLLTVSDLGDDTAAVQGLLDEHLDLEVEISEHGDRCTDICQAGQKLIEERNHHSDSIAQRCEQLRTKMYNLGELASVRRSNLLDNSSYLQFMSMIAAAESWISDQEDHVNSDDFGENLSSVETLLTKQETFAIGLRAFESEELETISSLRDHLIGCNHAQTDIINEKFHSVVGRWNKLLSDSQSREQSLLELQQQFWQEEEEARLAEEARREEERIEQERLAEEARLEKLRIEEEERLEQERLAEEARLEQLRIEEEERLEAERRREEEERLEAERKRLEEEEIARRLLEAERRIAEAERLKEIQRQEKARQEEEMKLAEEERKKKLTVFEEFIQREAEFIAGKESPAFFAGSKTYQIEKLKHFLGLNIKVDDIESNQSADSLLEGK